MAVLADWEIPSLPVTTKCFLPRLCVGEVAVPCADAILNQSWLESCCVKNRGVGRSKLGAW
jgi:hypothetical protein